MTYTLTEEGPVRIAVYDHRGRLVRVLAEGNAPAGTHETSWDGRSEAGSPVSAGIYFLRLDAGGAVGLRKVVRVH
jgi:flagellar hook assembly protein FlgD